ncbi:MAG: Nramp family divalent metal transporter, partial [Planctomycetaceae bacterium]
FRARNWAMLLGPGLVMGAAAIGGGEWLTGPLVTARYGGALLWLATLSILGQTLYNIEISRYTLYSGEPIFTGKFRVPPGPMFWLFVYLVFDFGSVLPYLASNAAIPLFAMIKGRLPDTAAQADENLVRILACSIFLGTLLPLVVGGKVYNSLKAVMTFKLVVVMGFLLFLAIGYSTAETWAEIFSGFFKFGTVPVITEGRPDIENAFVSLWSGRGFPAIDLSMIGVIAAMAAICGNGGLTNTPISSYTRDQGWGMGQHVGAIPSIVGGHKVELSHVGMVFHVTKESLRRWAGWMRHVQREQLVIWMPACFLGIALPSMLSVQFLPRGFVAENTWLAASITAGGVRDAVGPTLGPFFWMLTLFCGFLILSTSMATGSDGFLRRWVDVFWTASPRLRQWDPRHIGKLYFGVLCVYAAFGLTMLTLVDGGDLLVYSAMLYNYVLGVSCFHTLAVNTVLLPTELRPGWLRRVGLLLTGTFFTAIAVLTTIDKVRDLQAEGTQAEAAATAPAETGDRETGDQVMLGAPIDPRMPLAFSPALDVLRCQRACHDVLR